ncbi:MAG: hypothetical protein V1662_05970 [Candidatus Omnitrophota bacterium]
MRNIPLKSITGFTLTEILIALVIVVFVVMGAGSAHIGAHNFFTSIKQHSQVQEEVKIALEHITKNIQSGIGDLNNPAFTISGGNQLDVRIDTNNDGKFTAADRTIRYTYSGAPNYRIVYDPDTNIAGNESNITDKLISAVSYNSGSGSASNEIEITIEALMDPTKSEAIDNPKASLTSTAAIKGMSCR